MFLGGGANGQQPTTPISIMKKRSSNPIELRRSSGAVKIDLSSADKTIRRPGSEPDLKVEEHFNPKFFNPGHFNRGLFIQWGKKKLHKPDF